MRTLQYMLANGTWCDAGERAERFLDQAVEKGLEIMSRFPEGAPKGVGLGTTRIEVEVLLNAGHEVVFGTDWSAILRYKPEPKPKPVPVVAEQTGLLCCRRCGQTGYAGEYPFSTRPGDTCDDCL